MDLPDVSHIPPVEIEATAIRTPLMAITIVNGYGKYQDLVAYWHDIDKCFYRTDGTIITDEVAKTDPL